MLESQGRFYVVKTSQINGFCMENGDCNLLMHAIKHSCCADMPIFDRLCVGHFIAKHNKIFVQPTIHDDKKITYSF